MLSHESVRTPETALRFLFCPVTVALQVSGTRTNLSEDTKTNQLPQRIELSLMRPAPLVIRELAGRPHV